MAVCAIALSVFNSNAAVYTASASGAFTSPGTWPGGIVPPTNMSADTIEIPPGITITLSADLVLSGTGNANVLEVDGLLSAPANTLTISGVRIDGVGDIMLDSLSGNLSGNKFAFSGNMTVNRMSDSRLYSTGGGDIIIADILYLKDTLSIATGTLVMQPGSKFHITGATGKPTMLKISPIGNLSLPAVYDVEYYGKPLTTGMEISGSGLRHLTLDMDTITTVVSISRGVATNGKLYLKRGTLNLNGLDLVIRDDFQADSGSGIRSSYASDISILSPMQHSGPLVFRPGGDTVKNLVINSNSNIVMGSTVSIARNLSLVKGKIELNKNNMFFIPGSTVSNAGPASYVITGDSAYVSTNRYTAGNFDFPVGTAGGYAPCSITLNQNDTAYRNMRVRVSPGVKSMGSTGNDMAVQQPMVNATWFLSFQNEKNTNMDITMAWEGKLEVNSFDRSTAYMSHYVNNYWLYLPGGKVTPQGMLHSISRTAVTATGPFAVFDANTVTVENVVTQTAINIYPNPATQLLYADVQQPAQALIYNAAGQVVSNTQIDAANKSINVAALPPGMYIIKLAGDELNAIGRFVKQ